MNKIFCIGFNKTATRSLADFFTLCGLRSEHWSEWWYQRRLGYYQRFDAFADGFERYPGDYPVFPNLDFLQENFPHAKFILQTRSLRGWLTSRRQHDVVWYLWGTGKLEWCDEVYLRCVEDRNRWYETVEKHPLFKSKNFLFLDIDEGDLQKKVSSFVGIENKLSFPDSNVTSTNVRKLTEVGHEVARFLKEYVEEEDHDTNWIAKLIK